MPKTEKNTRTIAISIPIKLDDFLNRSLEEARKEHPKMSKSQLIVKAIEFSIFTTQIIEKEDNNSKA